MLPRYPTIARPSRGLIELGERQDPLLRSRRGTAWASSTSARRGGDRELVSGKPWCPPGDEKLGGCDRTIHPGEYAMNRPRGRLALIIFLWIVPAGWSIGRAHLAGPAAEPSRSEADDDPGVIQGKTIEEWLAALKDRDPAMRKRAVEVIGRALRGSGHPRGREVEAADRGDFRLLGQGPGGPQGRRVLRGPLQGLRPPEMLERLLEEHRRAVKPTRRPIRLVDAQGRPVEGAIVSTYFSRISTGAVLLAAGADGGGAVQCAGPGRAEARDPGTPGRRRPLRDPAG